ncbi:MAG TPA: ATP synthase F0 subunit C [Limnochordia bacterium]
MEVLGVGLLLGLAALGSGLGQGLATGRAMDGIARQPEATGQIQRVLIIGLAFIEALTLYALLVAILFYVKL